MKRLVIALDSMSKEEALVFAQTLQGKVWGFKVNDLLLEYGTDIIKRLKEYGGVFADPKLHDTPNTVFNSVTRIANAGADLVTVHTSGGIEMIRFALNAAKTSEKDCMVTAVTTLTSLTDDQVRQVYRGYPLQRFIETLRDTNVRAVVCAGREAELYAAHGFQTVVPGFRPKGSLTFDDQKRSTGLVNCDYLVVGRPVTNAQDPVKVVEEITEKIKAF